MSSCMILHPARPHYAHFMQPYSLIISIRQSSFLRRGDRICMMQGSPDSVVETEKAGEFAACCKLDIASWRDV